MSDVTKSETLRPILQELEDRIDQTIAETCTVPAAREETTAELERLADRLSFAAQAAKTAAQLRRRIREMTILEHLQRRYRRESTPPRGEATL